MAKADTLGRIECPVCGTAAGMRIAPDKNGEPFGYCDATCSAQLRIGGDKARLARFVARYPWAKPAAAPVTPPAPAPVPAPAKPAAPAGAPAPAPAPAGKKPAASPFDILAQFNNRT